MNTTTLIPPFTTPSLPKLPATDESHAWRIPTSATTLDGFREWFASPEFPERIRASFIVDHLWIEHCLFGEMQALRIPTSAATIDGFREWFASPEFPERIRASLIGNQLLIEPGMEDLQTHNFIKTAITKAIAQIVEDRDSGCFSSDGMLLTNSRAGITTVTDALYASYEAIEAGRVRISTIGQGKALVEWQGTPDWVLEIISNYSVVKDTRTLFDAFYRAGVPEYWLIDARGDSIDFRILRPGPDAYVAVPAVDGWIESPLFGCRFRLTRERNRVNLWRYRLEVEPIPQPPST